MECEKCKQAGKEPKAYRYEKGGRWEAVYHCRHQTQRRGLYEKRKQEKPKKQGPIRRRVEYTPAMDSYILANYRSDRYRAGYGTMKKLAASFSAQFGIQGIRPNQLIGRWHRLVALKQAEIMAQVRGTPSLPVLKFMEGWSDA